MPAADRSAVLSMLRARVARIEGKYAATEDRPAPVPVADAVDHALPDAGLCRGAVHEVAPARGAVDAGAAFAFSALVAGRAGGTVLWIEPVPSIWPAGALAFGLDPAELVLVAAGGRDGLWAAEESLRCPGVASCVLVGTVADLTASRRLQLAAEAGGVLGLSVMPRAALAKPSAARTRWTIQSIPGQSLPGEGAAPHGVGDPCWRLELAGGRGCRPAAWDLRWDAAAARLEPLAAAGQEERLRM